MARILLAEDDAAMRTMVERALVADGHTVVATHDGLEALEALGTDGAGFAVLVTDIDMPGLDGLALASKAITLTTKLKVVLMTAYADIVSVPEPLKPYLACTVTKPLALDGLRSAVRAAAL
jgi:DNA-binding NtrC family response regulator